MPGRGTDEQADGANMLALDLLKLPSTHEAKGELELCPSCHGRQGHISLADDR